MDYTSQNNQSSIINDTRQQQGESNGISSKQRKCHRENEKRKGSSFKASHKLLAGMVVALYFFGIVMFQNINYSESVVMVDLEARATKDRVCSQISGDNELVTEDDRDSYKSNLEQVRSQYNSENGMKKFAKGDSDIVEYIFVVAIGPIIYMAFALISFIGWLCYCMCCICDRCCPPCKLCCKGCKRETPYAGLSLYWAPIGGALFMVYILIVAIIGVASTGTMHESYLTLWCSVVKFMHTTVYGDLEVGGQWVGMSPFNDKLVGFNSNLQGFIDGTDNTFDTDVSWITNKRDTMVQTNTDLNDDTLLPNFIYAQSPQSGGTTGQVSVFYGGAFEALMQALQTAVDATFTSSLATVSATNSAGRTIADSAQGFKDAMESGQKTVQDVVDLLEGQITSIDDSLSQGEDPFLLLKEILNAVYGSLIGISILCGVCGTLLIIFKFYKLRYVLHSCWCLFSLLMIITFLLSSILCLVSLIGFDSCELIQDMLSDRNELRSYNDFISDSNADLIAACKVELGGNGNMLEELGIKSQLEDIEGLKNEVDKTRTSLGTGGDLNTQLDQVDAIMDDLDAQLNMLLSNSGTDYVATGSPNFQYDHSELAAAVDGIETTAVSDCGGVTDTWVTDSSQCTTLANFATQTASPGCYWIGGSGSDANVPQTNNNDGVVLTPNKYYTSGGGSCTGTMEAQMNALIQWRDKKNAITAQKLTQISTQQSTFSNFRDELNGVASTSYLSKVNAFFTQFGVYMDQITDTQTPTGLLSNFNCLFFGSAVNDFTDALCVSFINNIWNLFQIMIVLSFGMWFGAFFLYCTATRYAKNMDLEAAGVKTQALGDHAKVDPNNVQYGGTQQPVQY